MFLYAIRNEETRRKYQRKLFMFFDFIGLEGTLEEKSKLFVAKTKENSNWAFASVMKFLAYQKERVERKEISEATLPGYYKPIKLFCEMNDISLGWKRISRGLPKGRRFANDRAPTMEEIRAIAEYPDRRMKAIVYAMCSSGIRLGSWDYLKWGHIQAVEENGNVVAAKMTVYAGDEEQYMSFITPEGYRALKQWMDFREKSGEEITKDSWVMRDLWNTEDNGKGLAKFPKRLKSLGIKRLIERAINSQGLRKPLAEGKKRHEFQAAHGMRKFFKTRSEQMMRPINVEWLMGHSTGVSDSYYRPNESELLQDYVRAVPLLQISEVSQVKQEFQTAEKTWTQQFEEMRQTVATIQSQLSFLTSAVVAAKTSAVQV